MTVLLARGYGGTRVSEIASEAGLTPGSIYNHFSSKAELLAAAIATQAPDVISELMASGDEASVLDAFRRIGALLDQNSRAMGPLLLELVVTAGRDPEVAGVVVGDFASKEAAATELIRLAQGRGEIDPTVDAQALTRFTTMVALGSLVVGALELPPVDHGAWADVIDRMLSAVGTHPGG